MRQITSGDTDGLVLTERSARYTWNDNKISGSSTSFFEAFSHGMANIANILGVTVIEKRMLLWFHLGSIIAIHL